MSEFDFAFGAVPQLGAAELPTDSGSGEPSMVENVKQTFISMLENFGHAIEERNAVIDKIRALPEGSYKQEKIAEFKAIDNGGWFSPSFSTQAAVLGGFLRLVGLGDNLPEVRTLGFLPAIIAIIEAAEALPVAAWYAAAASTTAIAALGTYYLTQRQRYAAISINPQGVALADPTVAQVVAGSVGKYVGWAIIGLAVAYGASVILKAKAEAAK